MTSTVVEQDQKQIPVEDVKEEEVVVKDVKKDLVQGSGNDFGQSRSVEEICSDMLNLGVFPVEQVPRVTIEKSEHEKLIMFEPYVFKSPYSETYCILGDASIVPKEEEEEEEEEEEKEEVDETGVDHRDIELVMTQARVCRSKAVKAIKAYDGDIISAIMKLTS